MKNIKCGKALPINEFLVKKNISNVTATSCNAIIPKFECSEFSLFKYTGKYQPIRLNGRFVVYNDKYHRSLHIAEYFDMLYSILSLGSDFEDFDESDIIFSAPTVKECVKFMLKKANKREIHEDDDAIEDENFNTGTYDSTRFFREVMTGELSSADLETYTSYEELFGDCFDNYEKTENIDALLKDFNKCANIKGIK